jgi:hypothetical protein
MECGPDETSINCNTVVCPFAIGISEQNSARIIFCIGIVSNVLSDLKE